MDMHFYSKFKIVEIEFIDVIFSFLKNFYCAWLNKHI